jgi:hypothetical protein
MTFWPKDPIRSWPMSCGYDWLVVAVVTVLVLLLASAS